MIDEYCTKRQPTNGLFCGLAILRRILQENSSPLERWLNMDQSQHVFQNFNVVYQTLVLLWLEGRRKAGENDHFHRVTLYVWSRFCHNCEPREPPSEKQTLHYNSHGEDDSNDLENVADGKARRIVDDFQVPFLGFYPSLLSWNALLNQLKYGLETTKYFDGRKQLLKFLIFIKKCEYCACTCKQIIMNLFLRICKYCNL